MQQNIAEAKTIGFILIYDFGQQGFWQTRIWGVTGAREREDRPQMPISRDFYMT